MRVTGARLVDRHLSLDVTPAAKDYLANRGYDPVYGASVAPTLVPITNTQERQRARWPREDTNRR